MIQLHYVVQRDLYGRYFVSAYAGMLFWQTLVVGLTSVEEARVIAAELTLDYPEYVSLS